MIVILDYDSGNTHSIKHACSHLGFSSVVTSDISQLLQAKKIIVPGQGAFKQAMDNLTKKDLISPLLQMIHKGTPFFGICLGFQILFESSTEHITSKGLGLLPGHITKINAPKLKIPHMGWNSCSVTKPDMFKGIEDNSYFYFVHSFCLYNTSSEIISAKTDYSGQFISAVEKENIWGTQFHPEKSSEPGLKLLNNFLSQSI